MQVAIENLESIATTFEFSVDDYEPLVRTCMTTLSSKMCVPPQYPNFQSQRIGSTETKVVLHSQLGGPIGARAPLIYWQPCDEDIVGHPQILNIHVMSRPLVGTGAVERTFGGRPCSVGRCKREQAEMCVKAVLAVADLERKDVNLDLIKVSTLEYPHAPHWTPDARGRASGLCHPRAAQARLHTDWHAVRVLLCQVSRGQPPC